MEKEIKEAGRRAAVAHGNAMALAVIVSSFVEVLSPALQRQFLSKADAGMESLEASMLAETDQYSDFALTGLGNIRAMLEDLRARASQQ